MIILSTHISLTSNFAKLIKNPIAIKLKFSKRDNIEHQSGFRAKEQTKDISCCST
jgi:hypothetical protein